VVVVEQASFFLRKHHDTTGPVGESFEQGVPPGEGSHGVGKVFRV
jgi:hypothetical protein